MVFFIFYLCQEICDFVVPTICLLCYGYIHCQAIFNSQELFIGWDFTTHSFNKKI